jgi:mRNA interferase YafQ
MRTIEWTSAFKRDYKRVKATPRHRGIEALLNEAGNLLAEDNPLSEKHRDHVLSGNRIGHRECHLRPDLLLIYKLPDEKSLRFVRMGSHSDLFAQ